MALGEIVYEWNVIAPCQHVYKFALLRYLNGQAFPEQTANQHHAPADASRKNVLRYAF